MLPNRETLLCRYAYDPLDRLIDCTPSAQATAQRFYLKDRLATEIHGAVQRSIMQHNDQLLAQKLRQGSTTAQTSLLATDQQRSVLNVLDAIRPHPFAYTPYGHSSVSNGLLSLLGFNGERPDPVTGCYLLGNGYRAFNPVLMRFNTPDSWSPFGAGGLNAYVFCLGDPVNRRELGGHASLSGALKAVLRRAGLRTSKRVSKADIQNGPMSNVGILSDEVAYFDSVSDGRRQLNIEAHGTKPSAFKKSTIARDNPLSPSQLLTKFTDKKIDLSNYENIHLISCFGGDDGGASFAGRLAKITKKPVDGYMGSARVSQERSPLKELERRKLRNSAEGPLNTQFEGKQIASDLSRMGTAIRYNP